MKKGNFINYLLEYKKDGTIITADAQAQAIATKATEVLGTGASGVAILYSANYGQTRIIHSVYSKGGWNTNTTGANQANVMESLETLMGSTYTSIQMKLRIAPITTMNAYTDPVEPWNDNVLEELVSLDLKRIKDLLESGWTVLGWQNQDSLKSKESPYAIGGGIAKIPEKVENKIQETLKQYAEMYII